MRRPIALALLGTVLAGCAAAPAPADTAADPVTFENCGRELSIAAPPERVVLLGANAVPLLGAVGVLDKVVARAGEAPLEIYDPATRTAVERIPVFGAGEEADGTGTVQVSLEAVIAERPDLVIGYEPEGSGITVQTLGAAGIPLMIIPAFCPDPATVPTDPDFDDVYATVELYGRIFGRPAADAVEGLRQRVAAVAAVAAPAQPQRTGATLFVKADGTSFSAYGTSSMSHAQLGALGVRNVFGDVDKRVFEVSFEEVIARNPDVLLLLHVRSTDPELPRRSLLAAPGADSIAAVRTGAVVVLPFELTDPPTPLSVDGLERLRRELAPQP
ncbi:MAG: ABC transporter substrate-binding protein [Pseudonocardia sp.]